MLNTLESIYANNHNMQETLLKNLADVRTLYGDFFVDILTDMLIMDPIERSSSCEMFAILRPYSEQILDLKEFVPTPEASFKSLRIYLNDEHA